MRLGVLAALSVTMAGCSHKPKQQARYSPPPVQTQRRAATAPARKPLTTKQPEMVDPSEASNPSLGLDRQWTAEGPDRGRVGSSEIGMASWYGPPYANRRGANGEIYDQNAMTAAHRTLPMGTVVKVTNLETGQSATVKITDRGPFVHGRVIDLSLAAAKATGLYRMGVAKVKVDVFSAQKPLTGGKWCVQVGAFQSEGNAQKLKSSLLKQYGTAKVIEFPGPTGHWVRINPALPDKAHAQQIASSVHSAEPDAQAYLVRLD